MLRSLVNLLDFYIPALGTHDLYPLLCVMSCRASNELLRVSTQPFPLCPQGAKVICQSDGQLDRGPYTCDGRTGRRENFRYAPCGIHGAFGHRFFLTAMRKKKKSVTMDCLAASVVCHHSRDREADAETYHIHFNFHNFFFSASSILCRNRFQLGVRYGRSS